jgi:hypothetical protein
MKVGVSNWIGTTPTATQGPKESKEEDPKRL